MFVDKVKISIKAGNGGNGITSFLHFKGVVNGGPDGGDGGKGGDVIMRADAKLSSLLDYYYKTKYTAEDGANGGPKNCTGQSGADLLLRVPLGTVVTDEETGRILFDFTEDGQEKTLLTGGDGGKGNARFTTARRHAPHFSQDGETTERHYIYLELKTIADVGLVGFPNVGKSTLLSKVTAARPKIANYHFTTLSPNLGVATYYDEQFVLADIPGLIEGASDGAGLGIDFLKHIERTRMIVHVVDIAGTEGRDPYEDYLKINAELSSYSEKLAGLQQIVAANKCDVFGAEEKLEEFKRKLAGKAKVVPISAVKGEGLNELMKAIAESLALIPKKAEKDYEEYSYAKPEQLTYEIEEVAVDVYEITGTLVDVLKRNVTLKDAHSFAYMQKVLKDRGIFKKLKQMGAKDGDTVVIADTEFEYYE